MIINALKLHVRTTDGLYGRTFIFDTGLNVIRAENSSGKSLCTQAIIYGLGMEAMLSAKHSVPLPFAMLTHLEDAEKNKHRVIESDVFLEITNASGATITIRRTAKGTRDSHLITVWLAKLISSNEQTSVSRDYYVRQSGSATEERGFHAFLMSFLGWSLPIVKRYDGNDTILYAETIFPLFVVEQKRGWSGIQAAMPTQYQIRDVRRRAIEFVLNLEVQENVRKRQTFDERKSSLNLSWTSAWSELLSYIKSVSGQASHRLDEPTSIFPDAFAILVPRGVDSTGRPTEFVKIKDYIAQLASQVILLEALAVPRTKEDAGRIDENLRELSKQLTEINIAISEIEREVISDQADAESATKQLSSLDSDIKRHKDLLKLKRLGSSEKFSFEDGVCPTCGQDMEDSLLDQKTDIRPLAIEDGIEFLEAQRSTFKALTQQLTSELGRKGKALVRLREKAAELRTEIRSSKATLVADDRLPSEAAIEKRLKLKSKLDFLNRTAAEMLVVENRLRELSESWAKLIEEEGKHSFSGLSRQDVRKVDALRDAFKSMVQQFGLRSFDGQEINISMDNFHPTHDNFDLQFELSASDLIRMIWAYLLGLLEACRLSGTNHPGFLVFDEPQQQNIKDISFGSLLSRAAASKAAGQQVIVAISRLPTPWPETLNAKNCRVLNVDGWILQKL